METIERKHILTEQRRKTLLRETRSFHDLVHFLEEHFPSSCGDNVKMAHKELEKSLKILEQWTAEREQQLEANL
jgi:hypothetical protein